MHSEDDWHGGGGAGGFPPRGPPPPYDGGPDQRPPPYNPSPPPPGFKPEFTEAQSSSEWRRRQQPQNLYPDLHGQSSEQQPQPTQGLSFLGGTAIGGILGYLFGRSGAYSQSLDRDQSWSGAGAGYFENSRRRPVHSDTDSSSSEGDSREAHGYGGTSVR